MQRGKSKSRQIEALVRANTRLAKSLWSGEIDRQSLAALKELTRESRLRLAAREIIWLKGAWYVTTGGLLRVAKENRCYGIHAQAITNLSDAINNR
jgi:hypothetical protein